MALTMFNISDTNRSITINGTSGSGDSNCPSDTPLTKGAKTAAYVTLLFATFVGNVLVVHIIRRNSTLRTSVDLLIVSMCVSDTFLPLFAMPYRIKEIFVGVEWIGGDLGSILCKLVPFAMDVTTEVSILSMLAIAVERFRAVIYPTKPTLFTVSSCRKLIAIIWVLSVISLCVYFNIYSTRETGTKTYCEERWHQGDIPHYFTALIMLMFVIPMVLITVLYTAIVVSLRRQKTRMASHYGSEPRRRRAKRNRKTTFMLITVVVVFASAYVPLGFSLLLSFNSPRFVQKIGCSAFFASNFLVYVTSAVNPLIYFSFNDRYRQGLRQLLCSNTNSQSCLKCSTSPVQDQGSNTCAVVVDTVNHEVETQKIGVKCTMNC